MIQPLDNFDSSLVVNTSLLSTRQEPMTALEFGDFYEGMNFEQVIGGTAGVIDTNKGIQFGIDKTNDLGYIQSKNYVADTTGFRLDTEGNMYGVGGTIGGWTLSTTALTAGSGGSTTGLTTGTPFIYAGGATPSTAPFRVSNAGGLTITSTAGAVSITAPNASILDFSAETGDTTILNLIRTIASATKPLASIGSTDDTSTQNILNIAKGAGTGQALNITTSNTRDAAEINASSTDSLSIGLEVNHTGLGKGLNINLSNASNAQKGTIITQAGTGQGMQIEIANASNSSACLNLLTSGTGRLITENASAFYVENTGIIKINDGGSAPTLDANGEMATAYVSTTGRIYFRTGGFSYYVTGTAV